MDRSTDPQFQLVDDLHSLKAEVTSAQAALLLHVAECDRSEVWRGTGHKNMAYWLAAQLGINTWMAARYVKTSYALESLPHTRRALQDGLLSVEQTVELTRLATSENERRLIAWAKEKAPRAIRRRADNEAKRTLDEVRKADGQRGVDTWWSEDGSLFWIEGALPADQGVVVLNALERKASQLALASNSDDPERARMADALYVLASEGLGEDRDLDRATIVIHADLMALAHDDGRCEIQNGPSISPETARRLVCDGRLETVVHKGGIEVGLGRRSRAVSPRLFRALMKRDGCCAFPGCPHTRWLQAHHIKHWIWGGTTDLPNLLLLCPFHHRLVHEYHWKIVRSDEGDLAWYFPGRAPPEGRWVVPEAA